MQNHVPAFEIPEMTGVSNLMVERIGETTLKPDTPVICLNRGRRPLSETFDGNHVTLPAGGFTEDGSVRGYFRTEYGAAMHFQKRLIVPGTRTLDDGGFVSFIAILGSDDGRQRVDQPEHCQPFSDEDLQRFGEKVEGIDRSAPGVDAAQDMRVISTGTARAAVRGQGLRPQIDVGAQATSAAAEAAQEVFAPPAESLTREAEAEAAAERTVAADRQAKKPQRR